MIKNIVPIKEAGPEPVTCNTVPTAQKGIEWLHALFKL